MSEGRYVDEVMIVVAGYSGLPEPRALEEVWIATAGVGGRVDQEDLVDRLEAEAVPNPFALQQRWSHFSWGADGAFLRIVLEMSTVTGGIAGVVYLAKEMATALRKHEPPDAADVENAARSGKRQIAELLSISENDVHVVTAKPKKGKVSLVLETPLGEFSAKVEPEGLIHLTRKSRIEAPTVERVVEFEDES